MAKRKEAEETTTTAEPPTKAQAVREALAAGKDTPAEGTAWIKDTYGLDLANQMFSSYKTAAKKSGQSAGVKVSSRNGKGGDVLTVAKQVKELVDAYGHATVDECLSLFAR